MLPVCLVLPVHCLPSKGCAYPRHRFSFPWIPLFCYQSLFYITRSMEVPDQFSLDFGCLAIWQNGDSLFSCIKILGFILHPIELHVFQLNICFGNMRLVFCDAYIVKRGMLISTSLPVCFSNGTLGYSVDLIPTVHCISGGLIK